jgi:ATP-dependent DNA helicase RecQ
MNQAFDIDKTAEKMHNLFKTKEEHEIQRIHNMLGFFESESCISIKLAEYFGEHLEKGQCGHCSFCKRGKVILQNTTDLNPLSSFDFEEITTDFMRAVGEHLSVSNLTKFLCGVYTPVFSKLKIKRIPYFGIFESYPFRDVENWVKGFKKQSDLK